MKKQLSDLLQKHVDVFGFISVEEYITKRKLLNRNDQFDDYAFLNDYKTIITLAIPYPSQEVPWQGVGYGLLSRYSYNTDYHLVLRKILQEIQIDLNALEIKSHGSVDISKLDERYASYLSQIGFLGKNQFAINPKYGSYMYLATILIDITLDKDEPMIIDDCLDCTLCISACPTGALDDGFDKNKCLSNLTQAKKAFDKEEIKHLKTMIYGCDICQKVCPKNKGIDIHKFSEFEPSGIENVNLQEILNMSNREYKEIYGNNASSWRGATVIKRNALCLIANQKITALSDEIRQTMVRYNDVLWYNKTAELVLEILERE